MKSYAKSAATTVLLCLSCWNVFATDSDDDFLLDAEEDSLQSNASVGAIVQSISGVDITGLSENNPNSLHAQLRDYAFLALHYEAGKFAGLALENDSDGDGVPDWIENLYPPPVNPEDVPFGLLDLDGNGILNFVQLELGMALDAEASGWADTDQDGMSDAFEDALGLNPEDFADSAEDLDGDGLFNFEEYVNGTSPVRDSSLGSHQRIDSRWYAVQGVGETLEVLVFKEITGEAAPLMSDFERYFGYQCLWLPVSEWPSEEDPLPEEPVVTLSVEGMNALPLGSRLQFEPLVVPFPVHPDDWDGDGLTNEVEYRMLRNFSSPTLDADSISKALRNPDMNGDDVPDGSEDWDGDGLSNSDELWLGTLPWLADSDGDGTNDKDDSSPLNLNVSELQLTITSPVHGETLP